MSSRISPGVEIDDGLWPLADDHDLLELDQTYITRIVSGFCHSDDPEAGRTVATTAASTGLSTNSAPFIPEQNPAFGSASVCYISSTFAGDSGVVHLEGLDNEGNIQTAQASFSGNTATLAPKLWCRVLRMWLLTSSGSLTGDVYAGWDPNPELGAFAGVPNDQKVFNHIIIQSVTSRHGQSLMGWTTVPTGYVGLILDMWWGANAELFTNAKQREIEFDLQTQEWDPDSATYESWRTKSTGLIHAGEETTPTSGSGQSYRYKRFRAPIILTELAQAKITYRRLLNFDGRSFAGFTLLLIKN